MTNLVHFVNALNLLVTFSSFAVGLLLSGSHLDVTCDFEKKNHVILFVSMLCYCGFVFALTPFLCCSKPYTLELEINARRLFKTSTFYFVILFVAGTVSVCFRNYKCSDAIYWYLHALVPISSFMQTLGFYAYQNAVMHGLQMEMLQKLIEQTR